MKTKSRFFANYRIQVAHGISALLSPALLLLFAVAPAQAQALSTTQGPVRITLDDAIQLALQHNHNLLAAQTTILEAEAGEVAANVRPNPTFFTDWEYLPLGAPSDQNSRLYPPGYTVGQYLHDNTEGDLGLSYLIERGKKRQARLQAAKDITAETRSLVADNERTLTFNVASQFFTVQLAESALELAEKDVKSFRQTVDISEYQYQIGGMSEGDFLMIKLQLLQYETDYQQAVLAKDQGLDDLRNLIGYESVPADYDVAGSFDYEPLQANMEDLQMKALENRPDLRAAQQGVTAATSAWQVQKTIAKQDVTVSGNYSHVNGLNASTVAVNVPIPIFNQNKGPIAQARYAITQATGESGRPAGLDRRTRRLRGMEGKRQCSRSVSVGLSRCSGEGPRYRAVRLSARRRELARLAQRRANVSSDGAGLSPGARIVSHCSRAAPRSGGNKEIAMIWRAMVLGMPLLAGRQNAQKEPTFEKA